jgi:hypothetical protein
MHSFEASSALDAKRQAEAQIARAANCPPWRHAVFGLMMGAFVASPAFDFPIRMAIIVAMLCAIPLIIQSDRKRMGMFINGYRRGKTRLVTFPMLAVMLGLYTLSLYSNDDGHNPLTPLLLGVVALVAGILGSLLWQRVFVREMGA